MRTSDLSAVAHPQAFARTAIAPALVQPGVLFVVLMPLGAVRFVSVVLRSVLDRIALVFSTGSVGKVRQLVVRRVSVQVSDNHPLRTGPYEGKQDQLMNVPGSSIPVTVVNRGSNVPGAPPRNGLQDATLSASETRHTTLVTDFVQTFVARYRAPLLHGYLSVAQRRDDAR